jgi:hypothetical protein
LSEHDTQLFLKHLDASEKARWLVASYLVSHSEKVTIAPMRKLSHHKQWRDFVDDGDLYMGDKRVEVKHLSASFTSAEDWPFGYNFIVCASHSWDLANPKPHIYFILSKDLTHVALVYGEDHPSWRMERRIDSRYQESNQMYYFSPIEKVMFMKLEMAC